MIYLFKILKNKSFLLIFLLMVSCEQKSEVDTKKVLNSELILDDLHLCLNDSNNFATHEMDHCYIVAIESIEKEMDLILSKLKKIIPNQLWIKLKASQNNWYEYYKTNNLFLDDLISYKNGTMNSTICLSYKFEVLKKRVQILEIFYEECLISKKNRDFDL